MNGIQTINPDVLLETVCGDREIAVELLDLFFELAAEEMVKIADATVRMNACAVAESAHKVVGSALACGLDGLADHLRNLELHCRQDGIPSDIDERIRILTLQLADARTFFNARWGAG